jgi:hypothetical protein
MQLSCDINLDLSHTIGVLQVSKETVGPQTEYKVTILDPKSLGIATDEQTIVNRASQDLVLACDIVLQRVTLSIFGLELTKPNVMIAPSPGGVVVNDTGTGKTIEIFETVRLRDEVHITIGDRESLDESRIIQIFKQLAKLQRFNLEVTLSAQRATLINALHEYEAGMASLDRLLTFKHLYNVLELVTNIDGTDRDGPNLDAQMALVTSAPQDRCEEWRRLYNRTKHIHRDSKDVGTFVSGLEKLTEYIPIMRQASGKKLADLLMSV